MGKFNVLIIEDDWHDWFHGVLVKAVPQFFTLGRVDVATNKEEADKLISSHTYDLIILDHNFPEKPGHAEGEFGYTVIYAAIKKKMPAAIIVGVSDDYPEEVKLDFQFEKGALESEIPNVLRDIQARRGN